MLSLKISLIWKMIGYTKYGPIDLTTYRLIAAVVSSGFSTRIRGIQAKKLSCDWNGSGIRSKKVSLSAFMKVAQAGRFFVISSSRVSKHSNAVNVSRSFHTSALKMEGSGFGSLA